MTVNADTGKLDAEVLGFVVDMYGLQLDQLAALLTDLGVPAEDAAGRARATVARWRGLGYADTGELSIGKPWVWATRMGLDAFGLRSKRIQPGKALLRHTRAVTEVRLALERTSEWRDSGASWRSERQMRSGHSASRDVHMPDGEVHWPAQRGSRRAAEIWAVEVELIAKTVESTSKKMRQVLTRTGEYGGPPASIAAAGLPPRYQRMVWVCSPNAVRTVLRSRAELGTALADRVEVYDLPESALRLNIPRRGWEP